MRTLDIKRHYSIPAGAKELGVPYPTLFSWVKEGRAKAKVYERRKTKTYRLSSTEIARLRRLLSLGLPV